MVLFLGTVPPPKGGVSVYCLRRLNELGEKKIPFIFFDSCHKVSFLKLLVCCFKMILTRRSFEVEFNVSNPVSILIFSILGLSKYTTFIDHNGSRRFLDNWFYKRVFCFFSLNLKNIKIVNPSLKYNYPIARRQHIKVITPFIKPTQSELVNARKDFPEKFYHLVCNSSQNIVLVTAWRAISTRSEPDLYGLVDTLRIYLNVIESYPHFNFVFMLGETDKSEFCISLLQLVKALSKHKNFFFITGGVSQLPLLPSTKVLVRLSKTDGDSVSIREAIYFGAAVVASDVTKRPKGVLTCPVDEPSIAERYLIKILSE